MDWAAFFQLHDGLPREGPGDPADVARVAAALGGARVTSIADMGCGPGGDLDNLLHQFPEATVTAVDLIEHFVDAVRHRHGNNPRVIPLQDDMVAPEGPFDLIWSAGALYFLGLEDGLSTMREKLGPDGVLAFSYPCHLTDDPSPEAVAFWEGYPVGGRDALLGALNATSFSVLADWPVSDLGWRLYFAPMMARVARMRAGASSELSEILDQAEAEYETWRHVRHETGYRMVVARRHDD
ncbi:MAG: class I SAM-dependent methyltransferase [Pseudomonadota bacterium]